MARRKKGKKQGGVLADVFGITLEAPAGDGGHEPPTPNPAAEEREARIEARERAAAAAEVRVVAVDAARAVGIKPQRARVLVDLLDLSGVAVDSDGEPDTTEIERIVRAGAEAYPELRTRSLYGAAPGGRRG